MSSAEKIFERLKSEGEDALDRFLATFQVEHLFLDFKRATGDGDSGNLEQRDRNNLAKAISGFSNSEGGVIVWGIACHRNLSGADVAQAKHPIKDIKRFQSWIEDATSRCTIPPNTGVQTAAIEPIKAGDGFLATYIPKSETTPHRDIHNDQYYIRAGSSFQPVPHDVLAGLFGRRPSARIFHTLHFKPATYSQGCVRCKVEVHLTNGGRGIATDVFFHSTAYKLPDKSSVVA